MSLSETLTSLTFILHTQQPSTMPFSEIGFLKLKAPLTLDNEGPRKCLSALKATLADITGHPFYHFQSIYDPACVYLLGEWQSLEQHYNVPSRPEFQKHLPEMGKFFALQWMAHYDLNRDDLHIPTTDADHLESALFSVDKTKRESATEVGKALIEAIQATLGPGEAVISGWRHEVKDEDQLAIEILRHASHVVDREPFKALEKMSNEVKYETLKIQKDI